MAILFHIDVNSAYLSWTAAERMKNGDGTDLRSIPSIIGGDEKTRHGIVLAKSGPAKAFGIRTGEPVAAALRKCPFLTVVPPDRPLYQRRSQELMDYLKEFTSDLEQLSIDECFLDFGPIAHRFPSPEAAASQIKDTIRDRMGFTVNIGIAPNRLLAKMASDFQKPDRVHTLYPEEIPDKMWPLPVEELYMVGHSSAQRLHQLGIHTIGQLAGADPNFLISHFKSHGKQMWEYANGIASSVVQSQEPDRKGIGNSVTLSVDVTEKQEAHSVLLSLAETVSGRLRQAGMAARSVTVEVKYSDFTSCSHQCPLSVPVNSTRSLYETACRLFGELWNGEPIRLLGIRTSKLQDEKAPVQLSLFDLDYTAGQADPVPGKPFEGPSLEKQKKMDAAMDAIRKKYGNNAVIRGSLLERPNPSEKE